MTPQKVGIVGLFSYKVGKSRAVDQKVGKSRKSRKSRDTGQPGYKKHWLICFPILKW